MIRMKKRIEIGDHVSVVEDTLKGIVTAITTLGVTFLDNHGFERTYSSDELVVYDHTLTLSQKKIVNKESPSTKNLQPIKKRSTLIIDLHYKGVINEQKSILEKQLHQFQHHLVKAKHQKQKSIIFIHGVGNGILRKSIEKILQKKSLSYSDAPYHTYGYGAIEVFF